MKSKTFKPVIESLLDTDLYKLSMAQAMLHHLAGNSAEYRFVCRNETAFPLAELAGEVSEQLDHLCSLRYSEAELAYLGTMRWLKPDFIEFLRIFQFQRRLITVGTDGDRLTIVAKGPQVHVTGFEIFVLSIVNELYFRRLTAQTVGPVRVAHEEGRLRLAAKVEMLRAYGQEATLKKHPLQMFDFGCRRRFSGEWQDEVNATLLREVPEFFKGVSNMHLARKHGMVAIGTMAHEYLQTFQASGNVQLRHFQVRALETWVREYRGDLGIALTDTVTSAAFLADFDLYFGKLFDGLRHDSGDPVLWGESILAHYEKLRIDPQTKRLVFSDGLNMGQVIALHRRFADRIQCGFGIGTNLTNDLGMTALNIVMKLVACNGQPVAKISDAPGKTMCDDATFLAYLRDVFDVVGQA